MLRFALAAVCIVCSTVSFAQERWQVLDEKNFYGNWGASMTLDTETNRLNCLGQTSWSDGSLLYVKKFTGQPVYIEVAAPYWTLVEGQNVVVAFELDGELLRYTGQAFQYPNLVWGLTVTIDQRLLDQFGTARTGRVVFPNSREGNWPMTMRGTMAMITYLNECAGYQAEFEDAQGEPDLNEGNPFAPTGNNPFSSL